MKKKREGSKTTWNGIKRRLEVHSISDHDSDFDDGESDTLSVEKSRKMSARIKNQELLESIVLRQSEKTKLDSSIDEQIMSEVKKIKKKTPITSLGFVEIKSDEDEDAEPQSYLSKIKDKVKELASYLSRLGKPQEIVYAGIYVGNNTEGKEEEDYWNIPEQMRTDQESLSYRQVEKIAKREIIDLKMAAGSSKDFITPNDREKFDLFRLMNPRYIMMLHHMGTSW